MHFREVLVETLRRKNPAEPVLAKRDAPLAAMCLSSGGYGQDLGPRKHREIEKLIKVDEKKRSKEVKILLLGKSADAYS
jgi:hypothetical protein